MAPAQPEHQNASLGNLRYSVQAKVENAKYWVAPHQYHDNKTPRVFATGNVSKIGPIEPAVFKGTKAANFLAATSSSRYVSKHGFTNARLKQISSDMSPLAAVAPTGTTAHYMYDHSKNEPSQRLPEDNF